uniref:Malate synthase n=1 Tax=Globodera pallida TaxID=36090 RepID=A0A183C2T0_GLOPA
MTQPPTQMAKNFYQVIKSAPKGRYKGIKRNYEVEDLLKLRGSIDIDYTLATRGANKLWQLLHTEPYIAALGALTGNQAVQMVRAGLKAIYLSGWQVAADANSAGDMYPDQSLYPCNSGPDLARRINRALRRADQVECVEAEDYTAQRDWYVPIVADAEAGFGGALNCFELTKAYIESGVSGVHFEDQLGSEKKCGHMGGKVLIPTSQHIRHLNAARLAADVCGVPTIIVARTDAESARLLTTDIDERDHPFIDRSAGRTAEGYFRLRDDNAIQSCIERAKYYAPYCDLIWMETSYPKLSMAREFAEGVHKEYPDKLLHLRPSDMEKFQKELGAMGFKYQFITLAGFHTNNFSMFDLARNYRERGMAAYSELQEQEFAAEKHGYTAVKHQREVGTGYFDYVGLAAAGGVSSTTALKDSTEEAQFYTPTASADEDEIVKITAPETPGDERVLTPDALRFLRDLHNKFEMRRQSLLAQRKILQHKLDEGDYFPDFDPNTEALRADSGWSSQAEIPLDLQDRRVEITGPTDRKMVINAMNSGAKVFMADFEDANSPTWRNQIEGQINLQDAIRGQIHYVNPVTKQEYTLKQDTAALKIRPRGWHLPEKHVLINEKPISASIFDFGLYLFHNAKALKEKGSGPYFYLPKLENAQEAKLWADVFGHAEHLMGLPHGTIKCTVLIEHLLATFQMDEIVHALKDYVVGINCGRWDYIFSYIKVFRNHRKFLLPDRFLITMTSDFLRAYTLLSIKVAHQRNIFAMGHDGTWVAHPGLVPVAREVFDQIMQGPNQIGKQLKTFQTDNQRLTMPPEGVRTEAGFRRNISITLGYMDSWLRGIGCVPLYNLMEDAATAEISRTQLWQWLRHEARLEDGRTIDPQLVKMTIASETERRLVRAGSVVNRIPEASELLEKFVLEPELSDFLTLDAYAQILQHKLDEGDYFPDFDPNTEALRADSGWSSQAEIPLDLQDRRVEITGPTDRKMVINAMNSGAKVFMADFEDANSPTWRNQIEGQINLQDAIRGQIHYVNPVTKQEYTLKQDTAALKIRPRGWHLPEKHVLINEKPISASIFDFGLYLFHNAKALKEKGSGPYFYLPKLENAQEARLWADIGKQLKTFQTDNQRLTMPPEGVRTEAGFRRNISITLGYMDSWLRGIGCVPLYNLMEDAATAEISRTQLWQWLRHEARLEDGRTIDPQLVKMTIASETERRLVRAGSVVNRIPEASELLEKFVLEPELSDFLTLDAYDKLVSQGK